MLWVAQQTINKIRNKTKYTIKNKMYILYINCANNVSYTYYYLVTMSVNVSYTYYIDYTIIERLNYGQAKQYNNERERETGTHIESERDTHTERVGERETDIV